MVLRTIVALILSAGLVVTALASEAEAREGHAYGELHAAIARSAHADEPRAKLHEIAGHVADIEIGAHHAASLRREAAAEADGDRKAKIEERIAAVNQRLQALLKQAVESLEAFVQSDALDESSEQLERALDQAQASQSTDTQAVDDSISNLTAQINSIITN